MRQLVEVRICVISALACALYTSLYMERPPKRSRVSISVACGPSTVIVCGRHSKSQIGGRVVKKLERQKNLQSMERRKLTGGA